MDPVAAAIGVSALALSVYNTIDAWRHNRRPDLRVAVTSIEDATGEVHGVLAQVSNPGHRPIQIRRYGIADGRGETLDVATSVVQDLPATLKDGEGLDFVFDLDDLRDASERAETKPRVFRVTDASGTVYEADFPDGFQVPLIAASDALDFRQRAPERRGKSRSSFG